MWVHACRCVCVRTCVSVCLCDHACHSVWGNLRQPVGIGSLLPLCGFPGRNLGPQASTKPSHWPTSYFLSYQNDTVVWRWDLSFPGVTGQLLAQMIQLPAKHCNITVKHSYRRETSLKTSFKRLPHCALRWYTFLLLNVFIQTLFTYLHIFHFEFTRLWLFCKTFMNQVPHGPSLIG